MPVAITALYSGILALIIVAMGINVTVHRFRYGVMLGDGGQNVLKRMVRIHGNTVENIPLCALLMALYELNGGDKIVLHAAGIALIAGRILFAGPFMVSRWAKPHPGEWGNPDMGYNRASSNAKYSAVAFIARAHT